jgi:hypothetical protein
VFPQAYISKSVFECIEAKDLETLKLRLEQSPKEATEVNGPMVRKAKTKMAFTHSTRGQKGTPLHAAAGDHAMCEVLLKYGADVNAQNVSGFSPLMFAAAKGQFASVKVLVDAGE